MKEDDGYEQLMGYIVEEIKKMETIGFLLNIPGKGNVRIFGTLAQYTADNLGLNEAFGLVTSFNSDGCCALCYATRDEMRRFYREHEFEMRTVEKYQQDLEAIPR